MKIAQFQARCPYEVGDKIIFADHTLAVITDIMITYSCREKKAEFRYELNDSGEYVRFAFRAGADRG